MKKIAILIVAVCLLIPQMGYNLTKAAKEMEHFYIVPNNFKTFGTWTLSGDFLTGRTDGISGEPANAEVNITRAGNYRLWVRDRDFATNQPGLRSFQVAVDDVTVNETFGRHGEEGFRWSEVGIFNLNEGIHELSLLDTSGFYARFEGFFLSEDLTLIPPEDKEELLEIVQPADPFENLPSAEFPAWAKEEIVSHKSDSIENDDVKIVFHQGAGEERSLVQNELFVKDNGQWVKVKGKTEELGVLMMSAVNSVLIGQIDQFSHVQQTILMNGVEISSVTDDYFKSGQPIWFIPSDFHKVSANRIELIFPNTEADLKVSFELDSLSEDPKVTLDAEFNQDGAYSFMLYSGDGVDYEQYDTVTAPLLYVKKAVPERATMVAESYLFTPMATLHFAAGNAKVQNRQLTSGVVMDPTSVPQGYAYPDTSNFGLVLRDPQGNVRPQFVAPLFGNEGSVFESGDRYTVSYRIINRFDTWYDTLKHVSEKLYNFTDLRTNYYHSINEAIYNATDLMMDDDYGGWDPVNMAHYNMEERDMTTTANAMAALQRYLLTEDEAILDQRAIPTLAFMLSRQRYHFKITNSKGGSSYSQVIPTPMGGPVNEYTASVYGGLYEMTQGRMPFLLNRALNSASEKANLSGITDQAALYKYSEDATYINKVKSLADQYLRNGPNAGANRERPFVNSFVYGDYIPMVTAFLAAYEATGEQKYLDAAEEGGQLLATGLWTTGYHNNYAASDYTLNPSETSERLLFAERFNYWWHGDQQWRLGNIDGEVKPPQQSGSPLQSESTPGWLPAKAGLGTEHPRTPGHGNIISMSNWAGMLTKLSAYTGDSYFETMARNAIVGRYGNYPGYYQDRYLLHTMKADYPYLGPDYTSIYWHHIPVFISMLEDFLINSVWLKSEQQISFPSLYQSGYAYFASNQFGHAPGKFYDVEDMWLWLDRGIIEPDTVEIDYIAARKDGVLGLALMNEGNTAVTSTVSLGDKVAGGANYSGMATVYEADGTQSEIMVSNGKFTITIPAKGIRSLILHLPDVSTPKYAKQTYTFSNQTGDTVSEHSRGKGHVIQVAPDSYYAYVYISDMNDTSKKLTINYQIGEEQFTQEKIGYPYEFLIKVEDPTKAFSYQLHATNLNNQVEALGSGILQPYGDEGTGIIIPEQGLFEPIDLQVISSGTGNGKNRFIVSLADFPFTVTDNLLNGLRLTGTLTHKTSQATLELDSIILANEVRTNGTTVLVVGPTTEVPLGDYRDYDIQLTIVPREKLGYFEPVQTTVITPGMDRPNKTIRFIIPVEDFPFRVTGDLLSGMRVTGLLTHKTNHTTMELDSIIMANEMRTNETTVLVVEPTASVPLNDYKDYNIDLTIYSPYALPETTAMIEALNDSEAVNGWYTDPLLVTLSTESGDASVTETVYRINGGEWLRYSLPFTISDEGIYTLEYYSKDQAGYSEKVKLTNIQIDSTPPVLTIRADRSVLWPPNHKMVPVQMTVDATDSQSGVASMKLISITSNESRAEIGNVPADDVQNAEIGTYDLNFSLRAERSGSGSGRIYTITFSAIDAAGHETIAAMDILVPHNQS